MSPGTQLAISRLFLSKLVNAEIDLVLLLASVLISKFIIA
jgi:hypothetical protein